MADPILATGDPDPYIDLDMDPDPDREEALTNQFHSGAELGVQIHIY